MCKWRWQHVWGKWTKLRDGFDQDCEKDKEGTRYLGTSFEEQRRECSRCGFAQLRTASADDLVIL